MESYVCNICKYMTNRSADFTRHTHSESHKTLKRKHEKRINARNKNSTNFRLDNIEKLIEKNNTNSRLDNIEKLIEKNTEAVKKLTSAITFLNMHCLGAKPLKKLNKQQLDDLLNIEDCDDIDYMEELREKILNLFMDKRIEHYIGKLINDYFVEDKDLKKQRIWSTDVARTNYAMIVEITKNNKWVLDKGGELLKTYVIDPLIARLEQITEKKLEKIDKVKLDADPEYGNKLYQIEKELQYTRELFTFKNRTSLANKISKIVAKKVPLGEEKRDKILEE